MAELPAWYQSQSSGTVDTDTAAPAPVPTAPPPSTLPDWYSDGSNQLKSSLKAGSQIAPEQAAKVLDLKDKTGLPTDMVARNADQLQQQQDANATPADQFQKDAPKVSQWVSEDPHHAAVAIKDLTALGFLEKQFGYLSNQAERGGLDVERSYLGMKSFLGLSDETDKVRQAAIEKRLGSDFNQKAPGTITRLFGGVVESAPQLAGVIGLAGVGSLVAGAGGAAAATAGAFGAMEAGNAYLDFKNRKDAEGNPISEAEARGWALVSGVLNGAASIVPVGKMMEQVPGFRMLGREGINTIMENPTARAAFANYIKGIGESSLQMGGFSGFSSLVHNAAGELASMQNDGSIHTSSPMAILSRIFSPENLKSATASTVSGVATGMTFGGALGAFGLYRDYGKAMDAQNTANTWKNIGETIKNTKMQEMAPAQMEKVINRLAPGSHVFIPLEHWQTYWNDKKVDPRQAFQEVAGNTKAYDDAIRTGTDLQIPAAKYATTIAASDHAEFFNNVLRSDPLALNGEEAQKAVGIRADMQKADEEAKSKIGEAIAPAGKLAAVTPTEQPEHEQAVQGVQDQQGMSPLFPQPTAVGMTAEKAARYRAAIEESRTAAQDDVFRKITDRQLKEKSQAWQDERSTIQKEVEEKANQRPEYNALRFLRNDPGLETETGLQLSKLSRKDVVENDPTSSTKGYPEGIMADRGGMKADDAAQMLGFNSGSELLYQLKTMPKFEDFVKEETDRRMLERHPALNPTNLPDEAMRAVHNEERSKVLRLELEHLASNDFAAFKGLMTRIVRPIPRIEDVRNEAENMIGAKTTAETLPSLYQRAESVSSREAFEYFKRGDFEKAFEAKKQELLNHELFRAAQDAKEQTGKDINYVAKFDSDSVRSRIGKAGSDYLEQIDGLRERFDFGRATLKELKDRKSLREFVEDQQKQGYSPDIPANLLNEANKKSWREMTNDELHGVVNSMRTIDHLSGLKTKLLAAAAGRDFQDVKDSVTGAIKDYFKLDLKKMNKPIDLHPDFADRIKGDAATFGAWRTKMEFLFRFMDGGEYHGPVWETFMKPVNDAENLKTAKMRESVGTLEDIFKDYSKKDQRNFYSKITHIPELEGGKIKSNLNKVEMMMTALHWGNEGNRTELLRGYNWNESQVRAIWKNLELRDLQVVNKIWKYVDSFWPDIAKQERELNGLAPEKVQASPFDVTLKDGSVVHMDGGYFPLTYDRNIAWKTALLGQDSMVKDLFGINAARAATQHGWTNERVGGGGQAPSLQMSSFINHINDVIHDLAYRKPIIDLHKLINDDDIRQTIEASAGKELYKQLNPWLKRTAGDRPWNPLGPLEGLSTLRTNMTSAELGIKFTSAFVHASSYSLAARELGPEYALKGLKESADIRGAWEFAKEKSEFMRSRPNNMDRDIRATGKNLSIAGVRPGVLGQLDSYSPIKRSAMWSIFRGVDLGIAIPTWTGAYHKAMDGGVKNIEAGNEPEAIDYADQLVRDTKGSGAAKDLAPIQTAGGELGKLASMFYTQLNVIDNQFMEAYREVKQDRNIPKLMTSAVMGWFLPAAMTELLRGHTPSDDEGWGKWLAKAEIMYPINMVWGLSELVHGMQRGSVEASPVFEALGSMARTTKNIGESIPGLKDVISNLTGSEKDEWTDKDYSDALMSVGYTTGLPTRQAIKTTQYLYDWMTGAEQPDNPMEGIWRTMVGKKQQG